MLPTMETQTANERPRSRGNLVAVGVLVFVALLLVGGWVALHYALDDRLPVNAEVAGVDVGLQTTAEAEQTLSAELGEGADKPIVLTLDEGRSYRIAPDKVALSVDIEESVAQTGAGSVWNPLTMVRLLIGSASYPAVVDVDEAALDREIQSIADRVDREVIEGRIQYRGTRPVVTEPQTGREVDVQAARADVLEAYPVSHAALPLPVSVDRPAVDSDAMSAFASEVAAPAVAGPITIRVAKESATLEPRRYAPALRWEVVDGELTPEVEATRLAPRLGREVRQIGRPAVNATVEIRSGRPAVVPGTPGLGVDAESIAAAIPRVLDQRGSARQIAIEPTRKQPRVSTADAKAWRINEKVSSFETSYPHSEYRNVNQGRAAALVDGTILQPGETFSFNSVVGERTSANGFTAGTIISNGVFREELGGGVSQVATTLYNAAFFGGLEDVEHKPHSFYISRYPIGREATVAWPTVDLQFRNTLDKPVLIDAWVRPSTPGRSGTMHVTLWGTKQYRVTTAVSDRRNHRSPGVQYDPSDRCVPQSGVAGFDIDIYRTLHRGGQVVSRETTTAHYNAADTVRCERRPR